MSKKTLVIGASLKTERYSNMAIHMLIERNYVVEAIGLRSGEVAGVAILTPIFTEELLGLNIKDIHTVTLYLNEKRQADYYSFIISLAPKRVIFNPGTENETFYRLLEKHNIYYEVACTLVLLTTKQY